MPIGAYKLNSIAKYTTSAAGPARPLTVTASGNAQVSTAQNKFGGTSALFDGTGDYLTVTNTNNSFTYGSDNFTVELWFRTSSIASSTIIWDQRSTAIENNLCIYFNSDGARVMVLVNNSNVITSSAITANTWYHLAYSRSGNDHKLFLNGTQAGTTWTNSVSFGSTNPRIGANSYDGSFGFNGYIDEVRVSNTARYTANFTAPTTTFTNDTNTLLLLHMDGANASTTFLDDTTINFSNVSWDWSQYYIYQLAYAGLDSSSRPVFAYGYRETTTNYARFTMFRVNSDLTITQGSANTITTDACSLGVAATVDTDNNYGYLMYQKTAGGAYVKTFTIDKDNLSIGTAGSEATLYATSDAQMVSCDYAGGGRVHYFHRRGGQVSGNWYSTRSGTTLTIGTGITGNVGASTVYTQLRTFDASGSLYRHVIISNNGSPQACAIWWNNTSTATASTATSITWGTGSGIRPHNLVRLKSADKFMIISSGATACQVAAGTITWPSSGSSAATISVGSAVSLSHTPTANMYGAIDGFANDEAYVVYKNSADSKFYWRKFTASSNTLTEGSATEIPILSANSNAANFLICKGVQAFSKKYVVGVVDNSANGSPDIFVSEVT